MQCRLPRMQTMIKMPSVFSDATWEQIISACQSNSVPSTWAVGDSKIMTINGPDYQIDIIGKNHDTYAAGGTAPLTFQMHECYGTRYPMNTKSDADNQWQNSTMRTSTLPALLNKMPSEVQAAIKEISKQTGKGVSSSDLITTSETLFLLSAAEVFGEEEATSTAAAGEGTQYEYYASGNSKIKNLSGTASGWWLRSPVASNSAEYHFVRATGVLYNATRNSNAGVAFGFCF